ncbi:MAG: hypothetical protein IJN97_00355 [Oscillospiraceae bacterium]|nr:hypothetical protein [Oscillospiraceae bacterium]MBQ7053651.1 hypothetical protein [Oscillospiraceae bacterium]
MMDKNSFNPRIYQSFPQMVVGFHGCDRSTAMEVLNSPEKHLKMSKNDYDWLGDGIYFWLNDPLRALEWAEQKNKDAPGKIKEPFVIGAIIDLGVCLNFSERDAIRLLQRSYDELEGVFKSAGLDINEQMKNKRPDAGGFSLVRELDCAVIRNLHNMMERENVKFDTVYGYFQEGRDAYEGAGIKEKSHVQVCVRNTACIKGYFLPRKK